MPLPKPHRMHLRGPWEYRWLSTQADSDDLGQTGNETEGRLKMPVDWRTVFGNRGGTVLFRRRFHCPTNLEPHERVYVVFDGVGGVARIGLDGVELGVIDETQQSARFEVTALLKPANQLTVELQFDSQQPSNTPGGLWAPVAIEIVQEEASLDFSSGNEPRRH